MTNSVYVGGIDFVPGNPAGSRYVPKAGLGNRPVVRVSWYDAARFVNWMNNGQGNGDTESGAYTLQGGTAVPSNAASVTRNPNASLFLPTEDQWYKAAYYKGGGPNAGYWKYATRSDTKPTSDQPDDAPNHSPTNSANYYNEDGIPNNGINDGYVQSTPQNGGITQLLTDVGAYAQSVGPYGTFDQNGNAKEWLETPGAIVPTERRYRGGSYDSDNDLGSDVFGETAADFDYSNVGFRVAGVPEPASAAGLVLLAAGSGLARRHRHRRNVV
jgi:formylglycine-generating enzyme required for sulfatase activity